MDDWPWSWRRRVRGRGPLRGAARCCAALLSAPVSSPSKAWVVTGKGAGDWCRAAEVPGLPTWRMACGLCFDAVETARERMGRRGEMSCAGMVKGVARGERLASRRSMHAQRRSGLFPHRASHFAVGRQLKKLWEEEGTMAKWEASSWAKKRKAHALKATATDFDRFQACCARTSMSPLPPQLPRQAPGPARARCLSCSELSPAAISPRAHAVTSGIDLTWAPRLLDR